MSVIQPIRRAMAMIDHSLLHRWIALGGMAALMALLEMVGAAAVFGLIGAVTNPGILARVPYLGALFEKFVQTHPGTALQIFAMAVAAFFVVKNLCLFTEIHLREHTELRTMASISGKLLKGYLYAPYSFHFQKNSAELFRNIGYSVELVTKNVLLGSAALVSEVLSIVGLVIPLMFAEPVTTFVTVMVLGLMMGAIVLLSRRGFVHRGQQFQTLQTEMFRSINECLGAAKEAKITGRELFFWQRYHTYLWDRGRLSRKDSTYSQAPRLATETAMVLGLVILIAAASSRGQSGTHLVSLIGLFGYVGFRVLPSFNRIIMQLNKIQGGSAAVDLIWSDYQALCRQAAVEPPDCAPAPFKRQLELRDIRYTYPGKGRQILRGVSLTIPRGGAIGIVGSTGAGKSTLVDIILGLLQPESGDILVDGVSILDNPRGWQRCIGYVPQTIFLTDDTLRCNIAFGLKDDEIDEANLGRAVVMAQLSEFVGTLDHGLDTRIGERGIRLSGGQRQRIGVARALYHDPELLIFDEATSALDSGTEWEVTEAINGLAGQKTLILVAHRLSTLKNCDRLVMLRDGVIAAEGRFEDLLDQDDEFKRMVELSRLTAGSEGGASPMDDAGDATGAAFLPSEHMERL